MNNIVSFDFNGLGVRTQTDENGDPWFVASDVCKVLEHTNPSQAIRDNLESDEVTLSLTEGSHRPTNFVNESGLYSLILRSRKPQAKLFRKWITSEVLPAIRKNGSYGAVDLSDPATLRQTLLGYTERVIEQQRIIDQQAPKVEFHDRVAVAPDAISMAEAAKTLDMGRNRFMAWLRTLGWLSRRNEPYQSKIEAGYMDVKLGSFEHPTHGLKQSITPLLTGKGLTKLQLLQQRAA